MAGARVEIDVDIGAVNRQLAGMAAQLDGNGRTRMLEDMGEYLLRSTRDRGVLQISPDGKPWAALSPRYAKYKQKKRPGVPILKFDYHMQGDQLSSQVEGNTLYVGTNAVYGATHQFGRRTTITDPETGISFEAEIPARPWLGVSQEDDTEILQIARDHLESGLTGPTP